MSSTLHYIRPDIAQPMGLTRIKKTCKSSAKVPVNSMPDCQEISRKHWKRTENYKERERGDWDIDTEAQRLERKCEWRKGRINPSRIPTAPLRMSTHRVCHCSNRMVRFIRNDGFRVGPIFELEEVIEGCDLVALTAIKKTSGNASAAPTGEYWVGLTFNSKMSTTSRRCRASKLRLGTSETASMTPYWSASSTYTLQGKRREENK